MIQLFLNTFLIFFYFLSFCFFLSSLDTFYLLHSLLQHNYNFLWFGTDFNRSLGSIK